ncbi:MAG: N-acetyl-alpha-D-glucosaminyl L-malate synthase BshA [Candidatus Hatepunaea meridiana]|nr:N-acetyl-alpha-D-glucosaminyl L-malate synthase BshA [Candidatus Hatepunaea meridiana]
MRIGISCYPTFGGSGVIASELGMGLAERGHKVHFITYAVPGRLNVNLPNIYFHQVTVPDHPLFRYHPYSLALASKIAEVTENEGLELIHAHYAIPHASAALLAKDMLNDRLKVIITMHGTDVTLVGKNTSFMPIVKYTLNKADAISAVSIYLKNEIRCTFDCDRNISVINNFINPQDYNSRNRNEIRSLFACEGEKLLIHVSNFREVKRIEDVIGIFLCVRKRINTKLLLVGEGPDLNKAVQMAGEKGFASDVITLGNRKNVNEIIAASDVLLLPSEKESFGMVALEAMACGIPSIVTNSGGLPEVVDDGVTGYLSPVGDVEGMTNRVIELLSDEEKRQEMGRNGRLRAQERFNIKDAIDQYEELYRQAIMN